MPCRDLRDAAVVCYAVLCNAVPWRQCASELQEHDICDTSSHRSLDSTLHHCLVTTTACPSIPYLLAPCSLAPDPAPCLPESCVLGVHSN